MSQRLRPRDLAFLAGETPSTPQHNATVEIFDPGPDGLDIARLTAHIEDRIAFVPRYRQVLRSVPGRLANPVWVDDPNFDLDYHVRRSALPAPGSAEQLRELVARIASRPLDRSRPLWEIYVVEGLEHGRVAILAKSHQVLVDGVETVDLGQVLLDVTAEPRTVEHEPWRPSPPPSGSRLVLGALAESVRHPGTVAQTGRSVAGNLGRRADAVTERAGAVAGALANRERVPRSPLDVPLSQQRRFVMLATDLEDYRRVREAHGGTINDVVLATVAGGLRHWLMARRESLGGARSLRAVVPMSVIDDELEPTSLGSQVTGHVVDLPIGEASPVVRLHQVSYSFKAHGETGRAVSANRLAGIVGFAPTTFHALGARVAAAEAERRDVDLTVTNVPGPQFPLYAGGARMLESYPVHPLLPDRALAIGVTSYDGGVFYGVNADRDAVPDAPTLGQCLADALEELRGHDERDAHPRPTGPHGPRPPAVPAPRRHPEGRRVSERVYLPLGEAGLARLVAEGRLDGPLAAHAVTPALRAAWPDGDEEEWSWAALMAAAEASRAARGPADRPRRHVLAVDVPGWEPDPGPEDDPTRVRVDADVPWKRVASAHVDTADDAAEDDELAWFATQEIRSLVAGDAP